MTREEFKKLRKELLATIYFDVIHDYMKLTKWTWLSIDGSYIPSKKQLRKAAKRLLRDAYNDSNITQKPASVSYGGFHAEVDDTGMELSFIITSSAAER